MKTFAHVDAAGNIVGIGMVYYEGGGLTEAVAAFVKRLGLDAGLIAYGDTVRADPTHTTVVVDTVDMPGDNPQGYDKLFRGAFKYADGKCVECPVKSKEIAHGYRRAAREAEFAPHDESIAKMIPGRADEAELARAAIRAKYDAVQVQLDACTTPDELRAVLMGVRS